MALLNLDLTNVEQQQAYDPLPPGWYPAMITESEVGSTKANDGSTKLDLVFVITDGQFKGRKVYNTLNIGNKNEIAKEIALKQLSSIAHAVNVLNVQQSEWLHEKPLMIRLKIRQASGEFDAANDVTGYKAFDGAATAQPGAPSAPPAFTPPAAAPAFVPPATPATPAAAAPAFVPPPAAAPAPVVAAPVKQLTAKANGASYQSYIDAGWTDETLVEHGYMDAPVAAPVAQQPWEQPQVATQPAAAPATPVAPVVAAPATAVPPWAAPAAQ